jgi:hypothetical protein
MAILKFTSIFPGEINVGPRLARLLCTDSYETITEAGYLTTSSLDGNPLSPSDYIFVSYGANSDTHAILTPTFSNGLITLIPLPISGGDVLLPVVTNHLAVFTNTVGQIGDPSGTAIHGGNLQAGLSGTAGYVASFPSTSAKGSLRVTAVANTGDTVTTISNAAMGQASTITIPDPSSASANFLVAAAPLANGNLVVANGTAGLTSNSGITATNVQLASNIKAFNYSYAGGSATATVPLTGVTTSSIAVANIATSTNPAVVDFVKILAPNQLTIVFSADPGASTINIIAFLAPQ